MVNNEEMTSQEQFKAKEFLLKEEDLFAQSIENLGRTNVTTHSINTGDATPIKQGYYRAAYEENELFELIEVLPYVRYNAVKRIEKVQERAKEKYDNQLSPIKEIKKGELVLVYKASQQHSKSHKLHPKWKGPFVVHKVLQKGKTSQGWTSRNKNVDDYIKEFQLIATKYDNGFGSRFSTTWLDGKRIISGEDEECTQSCVVALKFYLAHERIS
ncbi:1638_t:CDS:2 [Ambispora leptoticha]|uniref:1638_t:CDS:1 n=1 Tax=Ambispora leptoticha TaxID=144679 RepID=A0A9N9G9B9_9GLOM|nr:1638_t:CDS:2 [Ambispora leptoticha]